MVHKYVHAKLILNKNHRNGEGLTGLKGLCRTIFRERVVFCNVIVLYYGWREHYPPVVLVHIETFEQLDVVGQGTTVSLERTKSPMECDREHFLNASPVVFRTNRKYKHGHMKENNVPTCNAERNGIFSCSLISFNYLRSIIIYGGEYNDEFNIRIAQVKRTFHNMKKASLKKCLEVGTRASQCYINDTKYVHQTCWCLSISLDLSLYPLALSPL